MHAMRCGEGGLTRLERAVLRAIAAEQSEHTTGLLAQFGAARVVARRNTGAGFFTDLAVDRDVAAAVPLAAPVGHVWCDVAGLRGPMTFVLFMQVGYAATLEGATVEDETHGVDFGRAAFALRP